MFKKTLLGVIVAAGSLTSLVPGVANAQYSAIVSVAPPAPLQERAPAPREGFVWAPGHYEWRGDQYVWVRGRWLEARSGYEYREPRWVQRANGEWYMVGNNWERRGPYGDRDRDGIANRYDRDDYARHDRRGRRFGPYGDIDRDGIPNMDDRDRDGDGVRNRRDRFPDDWRRS
jgi:YXWGXW repeat-containing protein